MFSAKAACRPRADLTLQKVSLYGFTASIDMVQGLVEGLTMPEFHPHRLGGGDVRQALQIRPGGEPPRVGGDRDTRLRPALWGLFDSTALMRAQISASLTVAAPGMRVRSKRCHPLGRQGERANHRPSPRRAAPSSSTATCWSSREDWRPFGAAHQSVHSTRRRDQGAATSWAPARSRGRRAAEIGVGE